MVSVLAVTVLDQNDELVSNAAIVATSREGAGTYELVWHPDRNQYIIENIYPGFFDVTVESSGFASQTHRVQVHYKPTHETFFVTAEGERYVYVSGTRVPNTASPDLIAVVPEIAGSDLLDADLESATGPNDRSQELDRLFQL